MEAISTKVQYYSKLVYQLTRGLPGNPIVAMLKAHVSGFPIQNCVVEFRSPKKHKKCTEKYF
jgi:hypothetical protein